MASPRPDNTVDQNNVRQRTGARDLGAYASTLGEGLLVLSLLTRLWPQTLGGGNFSCLKNTVSSEIHLNFQDFKILRLLKEDQEIKEDGDLENKGLCCPQLFNKGLLIAKHFT